MKKISTISLFIFGVVVTAILTAGLVFYQNKKDNQVANSQAGILAQNTVDQLTSSGQSLILDMAEIKKHNKQSDCWFLISGKVYNITSYFGSHPGGNSPMAATCGEDATVAYMTQDPNATNSGSRSAHSSEAKSLLTDYYLGDFNQTIGKQNTNIANTPVPTSENNQNINSKPNNTNPLPVVTPVIPPAGNLTLSLAEISKHNKQSDCWFLISGKVYNITSYFGSHPGGNAKMLATCGEDATAEYATQNPSATSSSGSSAHSANATSMLANYYIGDLNQTIGAQKISETNTVVPSPSNGEVEDEDEDEDDD